MTLLPRAYVLGNWSRFVRPGFVRVAATPLSQEYLYLSAFHDPAGGRIVVVAVNQKYNDLSAGLHDRGRHGHAADALADRGGHEPAGAGRVSVVDGKFTAVLPARSVTTFVGTATP